MIKPRPLPTLRRAFRRARDSDRGVLHGAIIFGFEAGESMERLAEQYRIERAEVEEIIRAYGKR